jgi:hypothetical protein
MDTNLTFYIYKETIRENIERTPHILLQVVEAYKVVACFKEGFHHMYIQVNKDPDQQWFPTQYKLMEEEMGNIMDVWDDEWKIPPTVTYPSTQPNAKVYDDNEEK